MCTSTFIPLGGDLTSVLTHTQFIVSAPGTLQMCDINCCCLFVVREFIGGCVNGQVSKKQTNNKNNKTAHTVQEIE